MDILENLGPAARPGAAADCRGDESATEHDEEELFPRTYLGLLCFPGLGLGLLLLLRLGQSLGSRRSTDLGLLVSSSVDLVQGRADNSALVLDRLPGSLLGDFLGDALLVHATEEDRPGDLARVLALVEE